MNFDRENLGHDNTYYNRIHESKSKEICKPYQPINLNQSSKQPSFTEKVESLEKATFLLRESIEKLERRINPILLPPYVEEGKEECVDKMSQPLTELDMFIITLRNEIFNLRSMIEEIIDRSSI